MMPAMNPNSPTIAFRSPPAILSTILRGQPRNISAPIITAKPSMNRVMGAEPPFGANSFFARDMINAPSMMPIISGRAYCTWAALCSPRAPVVSRRKHAVQKPMFAGLPSKTRIADIVAIIPPISGHLIFSNMLLVLVCMCVITKVYHYSTTILIFVIVLIRIFDKWLM